MMSVSNVSVGAAASGYYKEEGYYGQGSAEGERASAWFGKAAEAVGLTGYVNDAHFALLLDGQAPDGKEMGRYVEGERQHRPGLDLTFSASKSASVAALVIGDTRIVKAHDAAVRAAMAVVEERFIKTRFQQNGEIVTKSANGILAGIYRHDTSRALDPNLHSHAVIANMAKNENGGYSAIRNEAVFSNRKLITEIYRSHFETAIADLGIATERGKYGEVNVSGIPQTVLEAFSKRRQEILKALDAKGLDYSPENASKATLATRATKHKNIDRATLRADWQSDALAAGLDRETLEQGQMKASRTEPGIAQDAPPPGILAKTKAVIAGAIAAPHRFPDPGQALDRAIAHISEREATYTRGDLTVSAMRFGVRSDFHTVDREIDRRIKAGQLFASGENGQILTDKASVDLERSILATWRKTGKTPGLELKPYPGRSGESTLLTKLSAASSLTAGQRGAVQTALTGPGRYVGIQGFAGTGKTFMLERMAHYAAQSGYAVKGMAPSHQAVQELAGVLGSAETLAKITTAERHHPQAVDNRKTILVVDEASMVSSQDMRNFMDYAERTGAPRVVFVGDTRQLDAVAAGQPFEQLLKGGMRTAVMDEIHRQRNEGLKTAVYHAIRSEVSAAFERLGQSVTQTEDPHQEAATRYLALSPTERAGTRILTPTNTSRARINDAVRDGLQCQGVLQGPDLRIDGLSNRQLTATELADVRSYAPGDVVMSVATSKKFGLTKNALYVVRETRPDANALTLEREDTGVKTILPLGASFRQRELGKALVAYDRETRTLAKGDQVRFRITDPKSGITNGLRAEIKSTEGGMIEALTQAGSSLHVSARSLAARGIEHDYAATAHAVQGETVDRVIVAMRATERLATQKSFYVEISRARNEALLLTEDPERLAKTIARETGIRPTALETWLEGQLANNRDHRVGKDQPDAPSRGTQDPEKTREDKQAEPISPAGLADDKIKEIEKQAELVLQRNKENER